MKKKRRDVKVTEQKRAEVEKIVQERVEVEEMMNKRVEVVNMKNKKVEVQEMNGGKTLEITEKNKLSREMTRFLLSYDVEFLEIEDFDDETGEFEISATVTNYFRIDPKGREKKITEKTIKWKAKIKLSWEMSKFLYDYGIEWLELIYFNPETSEVEISASTVIH